MRNTPITDELARQFAGKRLSRREAGSVWSLCRDLERELANMTNQRDALAEAIRSFTTDFESIKWGYDGDCGSQRLVDHLFESLASVKEEKHD